MLGINTLCKKLLVYSVNRRQRGVCVCEVTVYWPFMSNVFHKVFPHFKTVQLFVLLAKCRNKSYTNYSLHRVKTGEFMLDAYASAYTYAGLMSFKLNGILICVNHRAVPV